MIEIVGPVRDNRVMLLKVRVCRVPCCDTGDHNHIGHMGNPMPQGLNGSNYYAVALNEGETVLEKKDNLF